MANSATEKFHQLMNNHWNFLMKDYPEWASFAGFPGRHVQWTDLSPNAIQLRRQTLQTFLLEAQGIDPTPLSENDRLSLELLIYEIDMGLQAQAYGSDYLLNTHMDNLQTKLVDVLASMPRESSNDWDDLLARLENFPVHVEQNIQLMRDGIKKKIMPFQEFMSDINRQIDALLAGETRKGPLFEFFGAAGIQEQNRAVHLIESHVAPAFRKFQNFLKSEYGLAGRTQPAWSSLPNGETWYSFLVKQNTTTNFSPQEIHQIGLKEVERINSEMEKIRKQVGFQGDRVAFRKHLLSSSEFCFTHPEDLLEGYREIMRKVTPELKKLFRTLPKTPCEVRAMPEFRAKSGPGGQYFSGSLETNRPGYFEANTYDLPSRPKWEMETLTLHETIPGHHFQISIAKEAQALPEFRRNVFYIAYAEGWALYAESLGEAIGLFKDPYSKYGYLAAEMLRSVRLVVDTGMHAMGWSPQRALDYFRDNVPATDHDSQNEINRYITWPAQALGYKVGELKIQSLRRQAMSTLGERFDIKEFHDELLLHGSLPLNLLEKIINNWVSKKLHTNKGSQVVGTSDPTAPTLARR